MLILRELGFAYPGATVFAGLSAEIGPGVTWVVGDDGSGKTTLMKLVAGRLAGTGTISLDGVDLAGAAPRPVAGCDPRDAADDVLGVDAFLARARQSAPNFDAPALERHLDGFELRPHRAKSLFQLSTGTRRKVGLAATLAAGAPVTLLDDPAAALDARSVAHLVQTLAEADRDPRRIWLVSAYAVPAGLAAPRIMALPPRR